MFYNFIELIDNLGDKFLLNVNHVSIIRPHISNSKSYIKTEIFMDDDSKDYIGCHETYEKVKKLIKKAKMQ